MNYKELEKQIKNEYRKLFFDTYFDLYKYYLTERDRYHSITYKDNDNRYYFQIDYDFMMITVQCVCYNKDKLKNNMINLFDCKYNDVFNSFLPVIFNRKLYKFVKEIINVSKYKRLEESMVGTPVDPKLLQRKEKIDKILKNVNK
jgi:hypothetical protein